MLRGQRNGSDRGFFEKANQRLKGIDGGDGVSASNIWEIGVLKKVCETPWQAPAGSLTGADPP